ncbi:MAG: hypothetical protein E7168_01365 [Firmicutes bacterium]|nr:hypothetical protein [Bacillota bacterium]
MDIKTQVRIRNNPYLYQYLRDNSSWYKILNRHPEALDDMEEEMKKVYKLNPSDKIDDLSRKLDMIRTFMDVLN